MPLPPELQSFVTDELKADPIAWPILEKATEKDAASVLKSYAHSQHRLGSALSLPGKDAKPEDVAALKQKLYDAGLFAAPPGKPEEYGIARPADLPEGLGWNDALSQEFAATLHKHGAPKALAAELLALHSKAILGAQETLKTSMEEAEAALRKEFGDKYEERIETAKRITGHFTKNASGQEQWVPGMMFKTPEEVDFYNRTGLGNHPAFLAPIMRLAPLAMQDSSFLKDAVRPGGEITGDAARAEVAKIMSDKTHPMNAGYWRQDPAVMKHIEELYRKAYGTAKVELSAGLAAGEAAVR